jgi:hypothetical protein
MLAPVDPTVRRGPRRALIVDENDHGRLSHTGEIRARSRVSCSIAAHHPELYTAPEHSSSTLAAREQRVTTALNMAATIRHPLCALARWAGGARNHGLERVEMPTLATVHHCSAAQRMRCSGNPRSPDDGSPTRQPDRPTMSPSFARLTTRVFVCVVVLASCGNPQADGAGVVDETSLSSASLPATRAGARRAIASPRGRRRIAHRWGAAAWAATCWSCWVGELFAEEELCPTSGWVETDGCVFVVSFGSSRWCTAICG